MRILVADDDPISSTVLSAMLKRWGFEVTVAADGEAALEALNRMDARLAILDWVMPKMDGTEVCRRIRGNPLLANVYVLMLTASESRKDVVVGLEAGADDYLTKPFDPEELRARLNVGVRMLGANAETERLLSAISSILIGVDARGCITRWNSAAEAAFQIPAPVAFGKPLPSCGIEWSDPDTVHAVLAQPNCPRHLDDLRFRDTNGREHILSLTVTTMQRGSEELEGFVLLGSDVTEHRFMEQQLRQSQKLEGIGQLAAGIAHEINTPMQYIGDNVRFLGDAMGSLDPVFDAVLRICAARGEGQAPPELAAELDVLAQEAERAEVDYLKKHLPSAIEQSLEGVQHVSRIVRAMKEFSHPGGGDKVPMDINHALQTALIVARNELKYVAETEVALDPELPMVPCLPGEMNQVLLNVLVNAAHAIQDVVSKNEGTLGRIGVSTHALPDAVEIRISDTGSGIPEAVRHRIFEPFFTTKQVGRGTGQGLALAHATVVSKHGGQIWFDTQLGAGTTFYIRLPLASRDHADATAA